MPTRLDDTLRAAALRTRLRRGAPLTGETRAEIEAVLSACIRHMVRLPAEAPPPSTEEQRLLYTTTIRALRVAGTPAADIVSWALTNQALDQAEEDAA